LGGNLAIPPKERFLNRFIPVTESGCWLWEGHIGKTGYGLFRMTTNPSDTPLGAHRASWTLFRGPIPDGLHVCHVCDVRACVNPAHLFLGTYTDNMRDAAAKGRMNWKKPDRPELLRGERHHSAKINENIVKDIRASAESCTSLAKKYGISVICVSRVKRRLNWRHVQ
jgi:hypothetical protein